MNEACEHVWQILVVVQGWFDKDRRIEACVRCDELRWEDHDSMKASPPYVYTRKRP